MKLIPLSSCYDCYSPFYEFYDAMDELFPTATNSWLLNFPRSKPNSNKFRINLAIGHYKPEQVKVEVDKNKVRVHGSHHSCVKNGSDKSEFTREFELPDSVLVDTLTHRVTGDGILVIEADKKQPDVRHFFVNSSDEHNLSLQFDVKGYDDKDVDVHLNGNDLIVSANHHSISTEHGVTNEKQQHFKRVIKLDHDVDLSTVTPTFTNDGYLKIVGKRDPQKLTEGAKPLLIKRE